MKPNIESTRFYYTKNVNKEQRTSNDVSGPRSQHVNNRMTPLHEMELIKAKDKKHTLNQSK